MATSAVLLAIDLAMPLSGSAAGRRLLSAAVVTAVACGTGSVRVASSSTAADPPAAPGRILDSTERRLQVDDDSTNRQIAATDPAALDTLRRIAAFNTWADLMRLGYISGPPEPRATDPLRAAVRRYERARGLPTTGDPSAFATVQQLRHDLRRLSEHPGILEAKWVRLTPYDVDVRGVWQPDREQDREGNSPVVSVRCKRTAMTCTETQVTLSFMNISAVKLETRDWTVDQWDHAEVIAHPDEDDQCLRAVMRINAVQESAAITESVVSTDARCTKLDHRDYTVRLVGGLAVGDAERTARVALLDSAVVLAPETRDFLRRAQHFQRYTVGRPWIRGMDVGW